MPEQDTHDFAYAASIGYELACTDQVNAAVTFAGSATAQSTISDFTAGVILAKRNPCPLPSNPGPL